MNRLKCMPGVALVASVAVFAVFAVGTRGGEFAEQTAGPPAAQAQSESTWTKAIQDRDKRGTLHDVLQIVRGDTGKWSDEPRLQHTPPIQSKPAKMLLDEWSDQLLEKEFAVTSKDDNWLLLRTRQLNDNDRVWVQRIERRGNRFTVVAHQAVWRGKYGKNFTNHQIIGVNLGQLEAGKYEATWIIVPLAFEKFDRPGPRVDNWPSDERPDEKKPTELPIKFAVVPAGA